MDEKVREIMTKVRETAHAIGDAAEKGVTFAGKRTVELVEISKLNMRIFDLNTEISILLREIGQLVYNAHAELDVDDVDISAKLKSIDEKKEKISEYKNRIAELKLFRSCPVCGELCGKEDEHCSSCGAKLDE